MWNRGGAHLKYADEAGGMGGRHSDNVTREGGGGVTSVSVHRKESMALIRRERRKSGGVRVNTRWETTNREKHLPAAYCAPTPVVGSGGTAGWR